MIFKTTHRPVDFEIKLDRFEIEEAVEAWLKVHHHDIPVDARWSWKMDRSGWAVEGLRIYWDDGE